LTVTFLSKAHEGTQKIQVSPKDFRVDKSTVLQYDKNMMANQVKIDEKTYRKPKRFFEKSGVVDPEMSYYVPLDNVVNTDKQDMKTMIDRGSKRFNNF
jgi:hypothetical protein